MYCVPDSVFHGSNRNRLFRFLEDWCETGGRAQGDPSAQEACVGRSLGGENGVLGKDDLQILTLGGASF